MLLLDWSSAPAELEPPAVEEVLDEVLDEVFEEVLEDVLEEVSFFDEDDLSDETVFEVTSSDEESDVSSMDTVGNSFFSDEVSLSNSSSSR